MQYDCIFITFYYCPPTLPIFLNSLFYATLIFFVPFVVAFIQSYIMSSFSFLDCARLTNVLSCVSCDCAMTVRFGIFFTASTICSMLALFTLTSSLMALM